jgi:hypothetical protein
MCDDARRAVRDASVALYLMRRLRPTAVALVAYRTWRRLSPEQRRQVVLVVRRNGPRLASSLVRRGRTSA